MEINMTKLFQKVLKKHSEMILEVLKEDYLNELEPISSYYGILLFPILDSNNKVSIIKEIKKITKLDLRTVRDIVEFGKYYVLKENISLEEAREIKMRLENHDIIVKIFEN